VEVGSLFDDDVVTPEEAEAKAVKLGPFDFVNAINFTKAKLIVDEETENQYNPYIVNRSLSFGADTIHFANAMNLYPGLPKKAQFDFLCGAIRPRKRFNKWLKAEKVEAVEMIKSAFGYSTEKAIETVRILTPAQLGEIEAAMNQGGRKTK
jgi:hypothetical protein